MKVAGFHIIKGFLFKTKLDANAAKHTYESPISLYKIFKNHKGWYRLGYKELVFKD